ncbi:hypothetical protein IFM89_020613 [Coptis chinensis]|uniref:Mitochondrial pyruvate carrier n=1 Tax=Coptis chinensis TaxID=261450 RepID=A0A835ICR0_9MAGN|nr:hypothetical protein IFM89_020613 [Coptis chinensis]
MLAFKSFLNSPVGPKTTFFFLGPIANWGFIVARLVDMQKPPEIILGNMTAVMCVYSGLVMRCSWMVQPQEPKKETVGPLDKQGDVKKNGAVTGREDKALVGLGTGLASLDSKKQKTKSKLALSLSIPPKHYL